MHSKKIKRITGSWFDFHHQNPFDGDYWNDQAARFTDAQWRIKVDEASGLGLDTLVLMAVTLHGKSFYPSRVITRQWKMGCPDPLEAVLSQADKKKIKVYLGIGFFQEDSDSAREESKLGFLHREVPQELARNYGHHRSLGGWYLPVEEGLQGCFSTVYLNYVHKLSRHCRKALDRKVLIAPYGTQTVIPDRKYVEQLKRLEADHVAYQDSVGCRSAQVWELDSIYGGLAKAHKKAKVPLWADTEVFNFEGELKKTPLVAAPFARILAQLRALSPYCEKILCYQVHGLMNPRHSKAMLGHPSSVRLYENYMEWLKKR